MIKGSSEIPDQNRDIFIRQTGKSYQESPTPTSCRGGFERTGVRVGSQPSSTGGLGAGTGLAMSYGLYKAQHVSGVTRNAQWFIVLTLSENMMQRFPVLIERTRKNWDSVEKQTNTGSSWGCWWFCVYVCVFRVDLWKKQGIFFLHLLCIG